MWTIPSWQSLWTVSFSRSFSPIPNHTLSLCLSICFLLSLSLSLFLSLPISLTLSLFLFLSCSLSLFFSLSLFLSLSLAHLFALSSVCWCFPLSLSISQDVCPACISLIISRSRSLSILYLWIFRALSLSDSLSLSSYSSRPPSRTSFSKREEVYAYVYCDSSVDLVQTKSRYQKGNREDEMVHLFFHVLKYIR